MRARCCSEADVVSRADFVIKHRTALVDFLEGHIRMRRWAFAAKTHEAAIKLLFRYEQDPGVAIRKPDLNTQRLLLRSTAMVDASHLQMYSSMRAKSFSAHALHSMGMIDSEMKMMSEGDAR
jgi:hypothetical protein